MSVNSDRYRHAAFQRVARRVYEWDPAEHDGQREPWESMEEAIAADWPQALTRLGQQATMTPPVTVRETDPATERRSVMRWAWTLPVDVPAKLAARCDVNILHGYLTWDPEQVSSWPG
jgi:hypothetical protein